MRYLANITVGSLKVPECRIIASLLLENLSDQDWDDAIRVENVLQARNVRTAIRIAGLIQHRLQTMDDELWRLIGSGSLVMATQACFAAAVKHSRLLGDFLDLVIRDQYRLQNKNLAPAVWARYIDDCHGRDPDMPEWRDSTVQRLRSSVFQILAQAGYIDSTRTLKLQAVHISRDVMRYLHARDETYVLRCIQVAP